MLQNHLESDSLQGLIYVDYHATMPVDPRVASLILHYMTEEFGNSSSTDHEWGDRAAAAVKQSAKHVAELIEASPREIIWTSGATESINLAIQGSLTPNPEKDRKSTRLNSSHVSQSRMPSSA